MAEFNVGDIREIPLKTAMAMDLAYDARPWLADKEHWRAFTDAWIVRQYGMRDPARLTICWSATGTSKCPCGR